MINTSDLFREKLGKGEKLYEVVDITFADGTEKRLEDEIMLNGGEFSDCANSSSFPVGNTICKSMKLSLDNTADQWKDYYFFKAKVTAFLKMVFSDGKTETIKKGTYTITTPEQYGEILEFTGLDDMYKANDTYTSKLQLPQDAFTLLRDACATVGISIGFSSMTHGNVIIRSMPDNMTFRQLIGWIAMLDSANARIDVDGNLQFIQWDFASVSVDYGAEVDSDGYVSFGKSTVDSDEYFVPEGGWYVDSDGYLTLREGTIGNPQRLRDYISSPTLSSDDIIITGIKLKNSENSVMYGKVGYVLELQNELVGDADLQTVASWIGDSLIGARFRSLSGDLVYNPLSEFGDMAFTYDRKGNKYITPITDISGSLNGITHIKTKAEDPVRGSSKFLSNADKALLAAKKLIREETKARELAVDNLQKALKDGTGMYETNVLQDDDSTITYLHDKPTLEESKNIIKLTSNAIGVSNDGGKTYPYGFILDGSLITRLLYAEGIDADYIDSGALTVRDSSGNVIFQANIKTNSVYIDGSVQIGGGVSFNDIKKTAEDAKKAAALAKNMTMQLSNEFQSIPVDSDGNYAAFPARVTTRPIVMYGSQNITSECSYTVSKSDSVTGEWDDTSKIYTVTGLSADTGWVDIQAAYINTLVITKRFSLAKQYAGRQGESGEAGRTYFIELSSNILKRGQDGYVKPDVLTARAYYRDGQSAARTAYPGRWLIETSTDGTNYVESVKSTSDETSKSISTNLFSHIVSVRVTLYASGGMENVLDTQTVPILVDVSALTQEEVFNLLTNNGEVKGIYKEGNQLFISFTYAKGGKLTLGGVDNQYGTLEVLDAKGEVVGSINSSFLKFSYAELNTLLVKTYFALYTKEENISPIVYYSAGEKEEDCVLQINCPVRIKSGGWYMTDDDWLRTYNEKSIYSGSGVIRSDYCFVNNVDGEYWQFGAKMGTGNAEWFSFMDATDGNLALAIIKSNHSIRTWGEIQAESANGLRIVNGNFGFIIRNDGSNAYLMPTTQGDPYGSWNSGAYSTVDLQTGQWTMPDNMNNTGHPVLSSTNNNYRIIKIQKSGNNFRYDTYGESFYIKPDSSDIRLKKNLGKVEIEDALSLIEEIKLHSFDWKSDGSHQKIGFIADELEQLDDRFSYGGEEDENGKPNYKSIDTLYMLGYTVKAIQELAGENKLLKKEINSIKSELDGIKNLIMSRR